MNRVAFRAVLFTVGAGLSRHFPRLFFMTATAYRRGLPGSGEVNRYWLMWVMAGGARFKTVMLTLIRGVTVGTAGNCFRFAWALLVAVNTVDVFIRIVTFSTHNHDFFLRRMRGMAIETGKFFAMSRAFFLDGMNDCFVTCGT